MELSIKQEIGKHMIESFMGRELSDVEFSIVIKSEYGKYFDDPSLLRNALMTQVCCAMRRGTYMKK